MNKEQENAFNPFNYNLLMERIKDKNTIEHKQYKEFISFMESKSKQEALTYTQYGYPFALPLDYEKIKQRNKRPRPINTSQLSLDI